MSEKKKYIPPFIYSAEMKSSQLLQMSRGEGNTIRQNLKGKVLDEGICFGNLSKESDDEGTLW